MTQDDDTEGDFWPGTGLFMPRGGGKRRYGVRNLIKAVKGGTH